MVWNSKYRWNRGSKMKSKEVMYSNGNNDECYTPDYGVYPILDLYLLVK